MKFSWSVSGLKDYEHLTTTLQTQMDKQLALLLIDLRYPSLRAKKYVEGRDIWQARLTRGWRFYFQIEDDTYKILTIIKHPD